MSPILDLYAEPTYTALHEVLAQYADMLTTVTDGGLETKGVTVIISGNRPIETISKQKRRYAGNLLESHGT